MGPVLAPRTRPGLAARPVARDGAKRRGVDFIRALGVGATKAATLLGGFMYNQVSYVLQAGGK
jgi:hypothetical protein